LVGAVRHPLSSGEYNSGAVGLVFGKKIKDFLRPTSQITDLSDFPVHPKAAGVRTDHRVERKEPQGQMG